MRGGRILLVAAAALVALWLIGRSAGVAPSFRDRPGWAAAIWPGHPSILIDGAMTSVGAAAADGQRPPPAALATMAEAARRAPLRSEPFLVEGAIAQLAGNEAQAVELFARARQLDPRAPAARYFLADHYLRTGRIDAGLAEMAVLSRLTPGSRDRFVPALAAYASMPGATDRLAAFLKQSPEYRPLLLETLANDPAKSSLAMALAGRGPFPAVEDQNWQRVLLVRLVETGRFRDARSAWLRLTGKASAELVHNPQFRSLADPAPFNWTFQQSAAGVSEPAGNGRLQVLYYERENASLAAQLLDLPAGQYAIRTDVAGNVGAGGVLWTVRCLPGERMLLQQALRKGANQSRFAIPATGCPAQWLELVGRPTESARTAEMTLSGFSIMREPVR